MLYVVLPIYPEQFGLSSLWEVGVLLSINRFVRIPIHPFVKKFYERYPTQQGLLSDLGAALGPAVGFLLIEMAGASSVTWGGAIITLLTAMLVAWEHWNVSKESLKRISEEKLSQGT